MRAESFFNFASYIDKLAEDDPSVKYTYGGKSLHSQSHGESFWALFKNKMDSGIYILDEPEAALSPNRQLAFMSIINKLEKLNKAQFIISTHSPILLCYPNARILQIDENGIHKVASYKNTEHYILTKQFLERPEQYFRYLFEEEKSP